MNISSRNRKVFRKYLNWKDVGKIDVETIAKLAGEMGIHVEHDEIDYKQPWIDYNNITVFDKQGNNLFYLKRVWEAGTLKEVLGMEMGRLFDPELSISNYVVGTYRSRILKREIPYLMVPWVDGKPIEEREALDYPFEMGKHYEFGRWLCLYDCHPRHYFLQENGSLKRIDYGQSFYKLYKEYEGFADIWPKALFSNPKFYEGIKNEHQKIRLRFDIIKDQIFKLLDIFALLELDDLFNFRGPKLKMEILDYWKNEGFLDENYKLKHQYKFLHTAKCETSPKNPNPPDSCVKESD